MVVTQKMLQYFISRCKGEITLVLSEYHIRLFEKMFESITSTEIDLEKGQPYYTILGTCNNEL